MNEYPNGDDTQEQRAREEVEERSGESPDERSEGIEAESPAQEPVANAEATSASDAEAGSDDEATSSPPRDEATSQDPSDVVAAEHEEPGSMPPERLSDDEGAADASGSEGTVASENDTEEGDTGVAGPDDTISSEPANHETEDREDTHGEEHYGEGEPSPEGEPQRPRIILKAGTDPESLEALELCREKVKQLHLKMHPLAARWDGDKHVTIFFRADDKVDFRKLVRELSRVLRARIELRQLGPREQGKLCGLVGKCGQPLCCQTFLAEFTQSSIKMAKTQDLALNPMKISGVCGRLLCCLNYEQEMYAQVKARMPKVNKWVDTEFGPGRVTALNVLKETVTVQLETSTRELSLDEVRLSEAPPQPQG